MVTLIMMMIMMMMHARVEEARLADCAALYQRCEGGSSNSRSSSKLLPFSCMLLCFFIFSRPWALNTVLLQG